jgi:hypothetical protein
MHIRIDTILDSIADAVFKETGREVVNRTVHIINAKGQRLPVTISTALLKDETEEVIGAVETFQNISRKKLEEKYTIQDIISGSFAEWTKDSELPVSH